MIAAWEPGKVAEMCKELPHVLVHQFVEQLLPPLREHTLIQLRLYKAGSTI